MPRVCPNIAYSWHRRLLGQRGGKSRQRGAPQAMDERPPGKACRVGPGQLGQRGRVGNDGDAVDLARLLRLDISLSGKQAVCNGEAEGPPVHHAPQSHIRPHG
jgi:hypothetical protein